MIEARMKSLLYFVGDPAGIGPDLAIQIAQKPLPCHLTVIADPKLLAERAAALKLPCKLRSISDSSPKSGELQNLPILDNGITIPGQGNAENVVSTLQGLELGVKSCMERDYDALITGPVHKGLINRAGVKFSGQTEFIADLTGSKQPVMMLLTRGLRVALLTTHLPLIEVPGKITRSRLQSVIRVLAQDLNYRFSIPNPRIAVLGLNPHAGDQGSLGKEEEEIMIPALQELRAEGYRLHGPLAADTAFTQQRLQEADVVLAMYHDQGLPVLKYAGFGEAINVTLGLPIIRTSVDHGVAYDVAGTGKANPSSLEQAITTAIAMAVNSDSNTNQ